MQAVRSLGLRVWLRSDRPVQIDAKMPDHTLPAPDCRFSPVHDLCLVHPPERRIGPSDEGELLGAEEHPAVQANQGQPLGITTGPAERGQRSGPVPKIGDHQPALSRSPSR